MSEITINNIALAVIAVCSVATLLIGRWNSGKIEQIKVSVDGKMDQLLKLTEKASHAEGIVDEKARDKTGDR